jgi:diguanylate cyclase (GGDEF)-like protein
MTRLSFRQKVLLLAVALVTAIQLVTLFPVLRAIRQDAEAQALRSVGLAGVVFDEFMENRTAQLLTTAAAVAGDFAFRGAVASGAAESALANHAARAGADVAIVFDLDGQILATSGDVPRGAALDALRRLGFAERDAIQSSISVLGAMPYQTVTIPVRAPDTIAWVTFGFALDRRLAGDIERLTGLHTSFVRIGIDEVQVFASTVPEEARGAAVSGIRLGQGTQEGAAAGSSGYLTSLRPFLEEHAEIYAALQLSLRDATAAYRRIRDILLVITSVSLLVAIGGAFGVARMVTRPVQDLAAAARRLREGIYTQSLEVVSTDELGDLAAGFNSMQDAIAERERRIVHIAHHDSLSGLPTRDLVVSELRESMTANKPLAVLNLALTRFDGIVSSLGHRTADDVIKLVAGLLRTTAGDAHVLGHLNYQEFIVVMQSYSVDQAKQLAGRLVDALRAGVTVKGANISLQACVGVAAFPDHASDAAELVRCAAMARNDAEQKHDVIGEYRVGQEERALELIRMVGDFPRALQNDELELNFQPKVDCSTRAVVGAEALVRWRHPELGLLPPVKFIEAIEQAGGIAHLTRWVLRHALMTLGSWRSRGLDLSIAVNISVDDLVDEYLPYFMLDLTRRHGIVPTNVTLEVTESAIMHNIQMSLAVVSCLRDLGFRVAIDDFGAGQSAMGQLKRMPVDELKIDKSFVINMENQRDEAIVRAAIELGHQFGLPVVAEGVESAATLERLQTLGCEYAQGYYIAKPLPANEFFAWVHKWSNREGSDIVALAAADRGSTERRNRG